MAEAPVKITFKAAIDGDLYWTKFVYLIIGYVGDIDDIGNSFFALDTIALPRTPKHTLVKPVDISRTEKGIGTIRICIKQLPTGQIDIVRELSIDVKDGIVTPKQYKAFRRMIQDWTTYKTVTIRAEKGKQIIGN